MRNKKDDLRYILFLDFDGVLHPWGQDYYSYIGDFAMLPALEDLLRRFPFVDVVVSSDWRRLYSMEGLQRRFSPDLRDRMIGATPEFDRELPVRYRREEEILAWLHGNGLAETQWVAVDDFADLFSDGCPHLVLTDPARALDEEACEELRIRFSQFEAMRRSSKS